MADLKITSLPALAEAGIQATDVAAVADISATETKKVTIKDLIAAGVALIDDGDIPHAKLAAGYVSGTVADGSITNVKLANDSVSFGGVSVDLGAADATPAFNLSDATAYPTSALVGTITNAQLAGSIEGTKLLNTTIAYAKLNLTDGDIPGAKITGNSITATQLATNSVTATELADDAVDTAAIADGAVVSASIATDTIVAGNIAADAITASELANNAVDTNAILDDAVTADKLANNLPGTILATGAIGSTQLAADSVTASEIAANAVTATELADNAVDAGALATGAVENAKLAANAVTNVKITDGTITAAKLATANIDRSLNVASGNLGINNTVTAATRSGITYNAQGLITGTVALAASDLPLSTTSAVGGVSIASAGGLSVSGAGALSIAATVTAGTATKVSFNGFGQITSTASLAAADLPKATASAVGGVSVPTGGPLSVDGNGALTVSNSGVSAGTGTKVTVDAKGIVTAIANIADSDLPNHSAALLTSGTIDSARIGASSITGQKLSNTSTTIFQSIAQSGYPTAQFNGQILFDTVSEDAYIWDGNAWQAITTLTKGSLVFGGNYNANTSKMTACTSAGLAAGLAVGSNLPTPSATTDGLYVVVDTAGTPSAPAPVVAFSPPDYILGVTNSSGSSWNEIDLSQTVAGQVASNITFTPYGQISSTNVQDALQELETEKLALAGGTVTGQVLIGHTGSLVFEGATADAFETTLTVADPTTSDKTITLPNVTGTVITTGDTNTVNKDMVDGSLVNANLASGAAISFSKLAALTSAQILVGNGSNEVTAVAVTGDIAITNAGVTSIAAGAIVDADISGSAAITGSKIATGTTSAVGVLQLTDSASSTSATTAATPAAVKTAKDAADAAATTANAALPKAGGTLTDNLLVDNDKEVRFFEADSNGSNYVGIKGATDKASSGSYTISLPAAPPTTGQVLKAGSTATTLEWGSDSATDATKMPLAGGTFTGDVTFTGDASNVVWDKSASEFTGIKKIADADSSIAIADAAGGASQIDFKLDNTSVVRIGDTGGTYGEAFQVGSGSNKTIFAWDGSGSGGSRVTLYYNNSSKLETVSGGINVTGTVTDDGATHDGDVTFTGASSNVVWDKSANAFTGTITATAFSGPLTGNVTGNASGSAATVTGAAQSAITSLGTLTGLTVDGDVTLTGASNNVVWDKSDNALEFADDAKAVFGGDSDAEIYHNDTDFFIDNDKGNIKIRANVGGDVGGNIHLMPHDDEEGIKIIHDGGVELYYNSNKKLEVTNSGGTLTGDWFFTTGGYASFPDDVPCFFGDSSDLLVKHASNTNIIDSASADLEIRHGTEKMILCAQDGQVELYHDNTKKIETTAAGLTVSGSVTDDKGELRTIPQLSKSSKHTIVLADAGKHSINSSGGWEFDTSTAFTAGMAITLINNSGSDQTIEADGVTLYNTADAATGNRTLASRGMATVICTASNTYYISGAGLS